VTTCESAPDVGVVVDCDVSVGIPTVVAPRSGAQALVLVRVFSEPIGLLSRHLFARWPRLTRVGECDREGTRASSLRERVEDCGLNWTGNCRPTACARRASRASSRVGSECYVTALG